MRLLGFLFLAGAALSILKAAVVISLMMIVLLLIWGALYRTAETFGFLTFMFVWWLVQNQPIVGWSVLGLALLQGVRSRSQQ